MGHWTASDAESDPSNRRQSQDHRSHTGTDTDTRAKMMLSLRKLCANGNVWILTLGGRPARRNAMPLAHHMPICIPQAGRGSEGARADRPRILIAIKVGRRGRVDSSAHNKRSLGPCPRLPSLLVKSGRPGSCAPFASFPLLLESILPSATTAVPAFQSSPLGSRTQDSLEQLQRHNADAHRRRRARWPRGRGRTVRYVHTPPPSTAQIHARPVRSTHTSTHTRIY